MFLDTVIVTLALLWAAGYVTAHAVRRLRQPGGCPGHTCDCKAELEKP